VEVTGRRTKKDPKNQDIARLLEQVPSDTDKKELAEKLEPILKELAKIDEPTAEAYLREIKPRFKLVKEEVQAYRRVVATYRAEEDATEKKSHRPQGSNSPYRAKFYGLVLLRYTKEGIFEEPLTNFTAQIRADIVEDDGVETRHQYEIEAKLKKRTERFRVPAKQYNGMNWVAENLGAKAIIYAGFGAKDHTRAAIQILSKNVAQRRVFTHTGWRKVNDEWVYLHAGGAIGPGGPILEIEVQLHPALSHYHLPDPPPDFASPARASLKLLEVAPDRVTIPAYSSIWRAVIGGADYSNHLTGPTNAGKTEVAALLQQHFGSSMDARNLPANWSSTDNALESIAFAAKDALLVIDDFVPGGTSSDIARWHQKADRVLRAQGKRSGRQRMRDDTTLRAEKPPRGLILSTGEDTPRGQSLRARLFVNDLADGDLDWERITNCQEDAGAGLYAQALAGFIWWLSLQYEEVQENLRGQLNELREQVFQKGMHKRTASIIANLALGFRYFLAYAEDSGAVNEEERQVLWERCWSALDEAAAAQRRYQSASDPVERFLELLRAVVTSGRAHLAGPNGAAPKSPQAWGWGRDNSGAWRAKGDRFGWIEGEDLYLEPQAAFTVAQRIARDSGETLPIGSKTLHKRLDEKKLLKTKEREDRLLVRRTLEGVRRGVLHLHPDTLLRVETEIILPPKKLF